jgi:hypothetical protein
MGPPETIAGWVVFLGLATLGAALGIAGRLRLGEAVTVGILAVPAGLAVGGAIDAARNHWTGPLRYTVPASAVAFVGYTALAVGVVRARTSRTARERPRPVAHGYIVLAVTRSISAHQEVRHGR